MSKFYSGRDKIKKSLTEYFYSVKDGKSNLFPRCHLDSWNFPCTLRDTIISPATDVCLHVTEYSASPPLTVPSVVHLIVCVLPGSQPPGLSVSAPLFLSPLQRFVFIYTFRVNSEQSFVKQKFPAGLSDHQLSISCQSSVTSQYLMAIPGYQLSTSCPSSVTSTMISHCADGMPSAV